MRIGCGLGMVLALAGAGLPAAVLAQARVAAPGGFVPQAAIGYGVAGATMTPVDLTSPLPVSAPAVAPIDRSGAIANGGAAQTIAAANPARRGFFVQNLSAADLWLATGTSAVAGRPSIRIAPGQLYESPASGAPGGAISVLGASAGQSFTAQEW
ncbi:hypothetical protein ABC347_00375 [Sphingomonas sp. 1P06PA]|uniref:hypothetical protein n=1 Tax=Sphingomonas sp. 1P06PA TaxID=554121 RepID=UPI0039A70C4C